MTDYKVIGIDLAKTKFHIVALNASNKRVLKQAITRDDFFEEMLPSLPAPQTFAFEACAGSHYMAQRLTELGHRCVVLKPKDVKAFAKARQKNDLNDALAICRASLDPELMHVRPKTKAQQVISYLHQARQNAIQQRIQYSNALLSALFEFGFAVKIGKARFAQECKQYVLQAYEKRCISKVVYQQMLVDCQEITFLLSRERTLEKEIVASNKESPEAQRLLKIPGIGSINASILANKPMEIYETARDFAASLGLVPKQSTTGGVIKLGSITKQGDRYARTMLIQGGRALVMRAAKPDVPEDKIYQFIARLKQANKGFNVICVAVANKLARIAYACVTKKTMYVGQ